MKGVPWEKISNAKYLLFQKSPSAMQEWYHPQYRFLQVGRVPSGRSEFLQQEMKINNPSSCSKLERTHMPSIKQRKTRGGRRNTPVCQQ